MTPCLLRVYVRKCSLLSACYGTIDLVSEMWVQRRGEHPPSPTGPSAWRRPSSLIPNISHPFSLWRAGSALRDPARHPLVKVHVGFLPVVQIPQIFRYVVVVRKVEPLSRLHGVLVMDLDARNTRGVSWGRVTAHIVHASGG